MKKRILFSLACLPIIGFSQNNIWGVHPFEEPFTYVFKINSETKDFTKVANTFQNVGSHPIQIVELPNNLIMGITAVGGETYPQNGCSGGPKIGCPPITYGALFEYNQTSQTFTKKLLFGPQSTTRIEHPIAMAKTQNGIVHIFNKSPRGIISYNNVDNSTGQFSPFPNEVGYTEAINTLSVENQIVVYSTQTVFKYNPQNQTYVTCAYPFNARLQGDSINSNLVVGRNGKLYGVAKGGDYDGGVLFEIDTAGMTYKKIADIEYPTSIPPVAIRSKQVNLTVLKSGKIIGTATNYGPLFEYTPSQNTFTLIKSITSAFITPSSLGSSIYNADSNKVVLIKYGTQTTLLYDLEQKKILDSSKHVVYFQYTKGDKIIGLSEGWEINSLDITLHKKETLFNAADYTKFYNPIFVLQGWDGKLYGRTNNTDKAPSFVLDPSTGLINEIPQKITDNAQNYSTNKLFQTTNGRVEFVDLTSTKANHVINLPYPSLNDDNTKCIKDSSGSVFCLSGGVLYTIPKEQIFNWTESENATKLGTDIAIKDIVIGTKGRLYGISNKGGEQGFGSIIEIDLTQKNITTLYSFYPFSKGRYPNTIYIDSLGILYGSTTDGGQNGKGVFFRFDPDTKTFDAVFSSKSILTTLQILGSTNGHFYGYAGSQAPNAWDIIQIDFDLDTIKIIDQTTGCSSQFLYTTADKLYYGGNKEWDVKTGQTTTFPTAIVAGATNDCYKLIEEIPVEKLPTGLLASHIATSATGIAYPNPFTEKLHLQLEGSFSVTLQDLSGKTMYTSTHHNLSEHELPLIPKGLYFVELKNDKTRKVIKINRL